MSPVWTRVWILVDRRLLLFPVVRTPFDSWNWVEVEAISQFFCLFLIFHSYYLSTNIVQKAVIINNCSCHNLFFVFGFSSWPIRTGHVSFLCPLIKASLQLFFLFYYLSNSSFCFFFSQKIIDTEAKTRVVVIVDLLPSFFPQSCKFIRKILFFWLQFWIWVWFLVLFKIVHFLGLFVLLVTIMIVVLLACIVRMLVVLLLFVLSVVSVTKIWDYPRFLYFWVLYDVLGCF